MEQFEALSKRFTTLSSSLEAKIAAAVLTDSTKSSVAHSTTVSPNSNLSSCACEGDSQVVVPPVCSSSEHFSVSNRESSDRSYNIVVSGIVERPHGTSRVVHTRSDFDTISSQLTGLTGDEGFFASIRDCRRLGKYSQSSSRPRPILVTLNSTIAVSSVLSLCSRLTSPISIRPDLTPADRLSRGLLLRERRSLLDAGAEKNAIRIRGSGLYVSGRLVGKVVNGVYVANQSLGDVAPHLVQLTPPLTMSQALRVPR